MTNDAKNTKPTHRAFLSSAEGPWTEIGAMWVHKDGKGFNLNLKAVPTGGEAIVLRLNEPKAPSAEGGAR